MGLIHNRSLRCSILLVILACQLQADTPSMPKNLPTPPPLPPELLEKGPPTPPPDLPDPSELFAQLRQLEELLSMKPEKLSSLRQTIEYIEKLSPDEREAMRLRLVEITRATPALRAEIASLKGLLPTDLVSSFSQFWLASTTGEREEIRTFLKEHSEAEQTTFLAARVEAFVQRREEVFARMKESLEARRSSRPSVP